VFYGNLTKHTQLQIFKHDGQLFAHREKNMAADGLGGRAELPMARAHYRGRRVPGLPASALAWMADKQQRDGQRSGCPRDLWLIHNKLYDLQAFAATHPGGAEWLWLTQGTDCTEAYEVHHLDQTKADRLLARYFVRDVSPAQRCVVDPPALAHTYIASLFRSFQLTTETPRLALRGITSTGFIPR
jgi:hypothetical protein